MVKKKKKINYKTQNTFMATRLQTFNQGTRTIFIPLRGKGMILE